MQTEQDRTPLLWLPAIPGIFGFLLIGAAGDGADGLSVGTDRTLSANDPVFPLRSSSPCTPRQVFILCDGSAV